MHLIVVFSTVSFSQEQSDRHPGGFGQPGEQPVCEVQQCGTEDHPQLEDVRSQRIQKGLDAHDFQRLQEHHREAAGEGGISANEEVAVIFLY